MRPIRAFIFSPLVTRGVYDRDMRYVYIGTVFALLVGCLTNARIYRIPLPIPMAAVTYALLMGFFAWTRVGRPPMWFPHLMKTITNGTIRRRLLPFDKGKHFHSVWTQASEEDLRQEI